MVRVVHEAALYDVSCMITLTYDDAHLPYGESLYRKDFQDFVKRLRKEVGDVRVFYCGEYGDLCGRPHYHAILFGYDFEDKEPCGKRGDFSIWRSVRLQRLWPNGRTEIGSVSAAAAAYVAGYVVKKVDGSSDPIVEDGFIDRPFVGMSLKPGIGFWWFLRYWRDVYPKDYVVIDGKRQRPPRAYDKWLSELFPSVWKVVKRAREDARVEAYRRFLDRGVVQPRQAVLDFGAGWHPDASPARVAVIREVAVARLNLSRREVK